MKKLLKSVLFALVLCATWSGRGDGLGALLLWMVDDRLVNEVTGADVAVPVSELVSRPDGFSVNYARVLATDGAGSVYLDLYQKNPQDTGVVRTGDFTDVADGYAGPLWARVEGYDSPEWSFMIELGHLDDSGDDDVWTPMAYSDRASYDDIRRFVQSEESMISVGMIPWTGGSYTVPEPTSGLLVVVGGALLALRRRRRAV